MKSIKVEKKLINKRSKIEIMASILERARRGAKKTHIMYHCNLSFGQLQRYLKSLRVRGLVRRETCGSEISYRITEKGQKFLKRYSKVALLLGLRKPKL
ncbi:MAG: winged helix-turn-helix domain-containing protein [Candidatus Bathyarchaeia archaeon]